MKQLLEHYASNKTLYIEDSNYRDYPVMFHEIKVIQMLEEGNQKSAEHYWNLLHDRSPELYGKSFMGYKGDKCLFSLCLTKYDKTNNLLSLKNVRLPDSKIRALVTILQQADAPVNQELIYELIWGEVPENKSDYNKLAVLVSQVRIKMGFNIISKKGCYVLEKIKKTTRNREIG